MEPNEFTHDQRLAVLVRACSDRDPDAFDLSLLPDGSLRIRGPYATACYPASNWAERFSMHLRQGYFTRPAQSPTVARQPAAGSGGTGP